MELIANRDELSRSESEACKLEIANCDLKFSNSIAVNCNAKSLGKRERLRWNASLKRVVLTPYNRAKSASSTTRCPRIVKISGSSNWMFNAFFMATIPPLRR